MSCSVWWSSTNRLGVDGNRRFAAASLYLRSEALRFHEGDRRQQHPTHDSAAVSADLSPGRREQVSLGSSYARANTTMPLAGITMLAEATKPCSGGPDAETAPPLPVTIGFTKLS